MPHAAAAAERQRSNGPKSEFLGKMDIRVHRTLNTGYYITWDSTWSSLFLHCTGAYLRGVVLQYKAEESVTLFPLCPPPLLMMPHPATTTIDAPLVSLLSATSVSTLEKGGKETAPVSSFQRSPPPPSPFFSRRRLQIYRKLKLLHDSFLSLKTALIWEGLQGCPLFFL